MKVSRLWANAQRWRARSWLVVTLLSSTLGVASVCSPCTGARADDSPYDAEQRSLAQKVEKRGRTPEAALDLWRMIRNEALADPDLTRTLFARIAGAPSVDVQHRVLAGRRVAWDLRRTGEVEAAEARFDALGYVRAFRVVGPFDNEGKQGFDTELGPELERRHAVDPNARYVGREREVRFRELPDVVRGGYVSFDTVLRPTQHVCAFAETSLKLDSARPLSLWVGAGGAVKVYFNGAEVLRDAAYRAPTPDRAVAWVDGRAGENRVLIKSCVMEGAWGVFLRVGDGRGEPLPLSAGPGQIAALPADGAPEKASAKALPKRPLATFYALEAKAMAAKESADGLENFARFLWFSGADDPAELRARQLAARAAGLSPNVERLLLASALAKERYVRMGFVDRAVALAPSSVPAQLAHAELSSGGPGAERALGMAESLKARGVEELSVLSLRIALLRSLGLDESALALAREGVKRAPSGSSWSLRLSDMLSVRPRKDESLALQQAVLARHYDHFGARRVLLEDALVRAENATVSTHLEAIVRLFPGDERRAIYVADIYDSLGRTDLSLATIAHAIEIAPESAELHVRHARALLRSGRSELAAESLKRALALRPQDAETRERLEHLAPKARLDESFAEDRPALLARKKPSSGEPVTVLQDLTVATVFENGLGSRFAQFAAEVHNEEGARRMRARSIQFDPETQRVSVRMARVYRADGRVLEATETYEEQLGEPWYRVYYDTRALVVVFPDLEPGDSIELRYRVDDVAPRNLYADYFGDLHVLGGSEPRAHMEYVLITPPKRKFFFNTPKLALAHTTEERDGQRVDRFAVDNLPALRPEPGMPGTTEVLPYLHVSTYASWDAVGKWWWGLVQDQLYADAELKKTVAELKKGAKDERELVQRIYGWVIAHTRYVALEFGIHGYLPYRVTDIARRGFGDCKDKASLIYTMLREAGVEARLVLVRTRQNGNIDTTPASLAVFDHAIAYVPGLDLYLDGTAEHSGITELPQGDQGVMVLVVGPGTAELRTTPVLPADNNQRTRKVSLTLSADGSGDVSVHEQIRGVDAARYRNTFEAPGTQRERLERQLAGAFPGLTLKELTFDSLADHEAPVALRYQLHAPAVARAEGGELRASPVSVGDLLREYAARPTRTYPLDLGNKSLFSEVRTLKAPPGFRVSHMPPKLDLKTRFGTFTMSAEQPKDTTEVVVACSFALTVDRVAPADYAEFRRFIEQADEALRARVAFVKEKP